MDPTEAGGEGPQISKPDLPEIPDWDVDRELERIRADAGQPQELPKAPDWEYRRPDFTKKHLPKEDDSSNYLGLGVGLSAAYAMIGCTIVGFGIGWFIDRGTKGYLGQMIGTLVGSLIGLVGAIFTIIRAQNRGGK